MKEKNIFTNIAFGVLLFILVIAIGFVGWEYSKPYRSQIVDDYLVKAEELIIEGDGLAMWELEKAYFVGLDYPTYRQKRALGLVDLGDVRAREELNWLVLQGFANDRINFECGKIAYLESNYQTARDFFGKMSKESDPKWQGEALVYLADMSGSEGRWEEVADYLRQADNKNYHSDWKEKLELAMALVLADRDQVDMRISGIDLGDDSQRIINQISDLKELTGDAYYIHAALVLSDLDLPGWGLAYLKQVPVDTINQKDLYQSYAYIYLSKEDCSSSLKFLKLAEQIDSTDSQVHEMLANTYQCLGLDEWKEWEEGLI